MTRIETITRSLALVGTALIAWASVRAHERTRAVATAISVMLAGFVLAMVSARVTGIADSPVPLEAWRYVITATFLAISLVARLVMGAEGALLARGPSSGSRGHLARV